MTLLLQLFVLDLGLRTLLIGRESDDNGCWCLGFNHRELDAVMVACRLWTLILGGAVTSCL